MKLKLLLIPLISACGPGAPNNTVTATIDPVEPTTEDDLSIIIRGRPGPEFEPRITWTRDGEPVPSLDNAQFVPSSQTSKGEEWAVTLVTTDGRFETAPAQANTTIVNSRPTISEIEISPSMPKVTESVIAIMDIEDPDDDELTITYEWRMGDDIISTEASLPPGTGVVNASLRLTVTATDGELTTVRAANSRYVNTVPTAPQVQLLPEGKAAEIVEDLYCKVVQPTYDPDEQELRYEIEYKGQDDKWSSTGVGKTEHVGDTISDFYKTAGQTWQCRARVYDGLDHGPWSEPSNVVQITPCRGSITSIAASDSVVNSVPTSEVWRTGDLRIENSTFTGRDSVGWLRFNLSDFGTYLDRVTRIEEATVSLTQISTIGSAQVVALNTPDNVWTRAAATPSFPARGAEISDAYQPGITVKSFEMELHADRLDVNQILRDRSLTIGLDNIAGGNNGMRIPSADDLDNRPRLELYITTCE